MKLALARVKVVGDRRSFVLPSAASSAAPTAKALGVDDRDADSRHHGFLLASAKDVGAGDRDADSRHHGFLLASAKGVGDWKVSAAAANHIEVRARCGGEKAGIPRQIMAIEFG